jgi:hypothetical protein
MLDPKEQAKGGFGARAAREQERRDALAEARREADAAAAGQGDGGTPADAAEERSPYAPPAEGEETIPDAPPTGRQPKRWR